jgi:hypothetical protein
MWKRCHHSQNFSVFAVVGHPYPFHLLNILLHSLMACNWLFVLITRQLPHMSVLDWLQSEISLSESQSKINSTILSLFSLCCFDFKAGTSEVCVDTCNTTQHKNVPAQVTTEIEFPFTKKLDFKRICEGTNCCLLDLKCN